MKKILSKGKKLLRNTIFTEKFPVNPFGTSPLAPEEKYLSLFEEAKIVSYPEIDKFEQENGFAIDKNWLDNLALHTQIVIKKSRLNYQHGRYLYTILMKYIKDHSNEQVINILETGTARGFSALCMAKALIDSKKPGNIVTVDPIPHNTPMIWNCIDDIDGLKTRQQLLKKWPEELNHIVFIQGWTKFHLKRLGMNRINFAFLDAAHTFEDLMIEYRYVKDRQIQGDIIVFDDVTPNVFDEIVNAIVQIENEGKYIINRIEVSNQRGYAFGKRK